MKARRHMRSERSLIQSKETTAPTLVQCAFFIFMNRKEGAQRESFWEHRIQGSKGLQS